MSSFKILCAMLLVSQAAAAADKKRMVRKSEMEAQTVESDGTVKSINAHSAEQGSSSMVDVSVSASGQAQVLSEYKQGELIHKRVQDLLADVQRMTKSGEKPAPHKSKDIQSIVNDDLLPGLVDERDFAEGQIHSAIAAFGACNDVSVEKQKQIKEKTEVEVGTARTTHVTCRMSEKEMHSTKSSKCEELDAFLAGVKVPQEIPKGRARAEMVEYVKTMNQYFCPMEPNTGDMDTACKNATASHDKERATCNRHQATFESDFCTWRTLLIDACAAHGVCYKNALGAYDDRKTKVAALVTKLKVEYASLKKILCYLDVWLSDDNTDTASADQYAKCNGADVDTSPMDIVFPEAPIQVGCPMTAVAKYPGTTEFGTVEYTEFSEEVGPVVACLEQ